MNLLIELFEREQLNFFHHTLRTGYRTCFHTLYDEKKSNSSISNNLIKHEYTV